MQIKTFVFINIGVTGLLDRDGKLNAVKLCTMPIDRKDLPLFLSEEKMQKEQELLFDFEPIKEYEEGKSLLLYDLIFNQATVEKINDFLNSLPKPVALVTFNGFRFHYPILRGAVMHYGLNLPDHVLCVDMMQFLYEYETETEPKKNRDDGGFPWPWDCYQPRSHSLPNAYERTTGKKYLQSEGVPLAHMLRTIECAASKSDEFMQWADTIGHTVFVESNMLSHDIIKINRKHGLSC